MFEVRRRRDLVRELASLRRELAELKAGLADQVTTQQLVVTDGDGVERVAVRADETTGSVLVRVDSAAGAPTGENRGHTGDPAADPAVIPLDPWRHADADRHLDQPSS